MKQVTILALVIILAVTTTCSRKVSKVLSDETTTKPEPECMPDNAYYCSQNSDCCSNDCRTEWVAGAAFTYCKPEPPTCKTNGYACEENQECCSEYCKRYHFLYQFCAADAGSI